MNIKTSNSVLSIAGIALGLAGLILILLSIFTEKDTLKWACYDEAIFIEDSETVVIHEMKSDYTNRYPVSDVYYQ